MARVAPLLGVLILALACRSEPREAAPRKLAAGEAAPREPDDPHDAAEPEHRLIRYACQGFDAAVAEGAPHDRLLASSARHAVALGGEQVERATQRWALLPPQGLLELIDRYERDAGVDPRECAGLRAHLDRMAMRAATR